MCELDVAFIYANRGHFDLRFNGKGKLREAAEKPRMSLSPLSNDGKYFVQTLDNGVMVHALRGTPGSSSSNPGRLTIPESARKPSLDEYDARP